MPSHRLPLILAWILVAVAILAALAYLYVSPTQDLPPSAKGQPRDSEVRISLSDVPAEAETEIGSEPAASAADATTVRPEDPKGDKVTDAPKIAIVVSGLGLSQKNTAAAIQALPASISLSFTPYGDDLDRWLTEARENGHEVMIDLPMEPASYPSNDPGPKALIASLPASENQARLLWILERGGDALGVTGVMGSRFARSSDLMRPVLETLKERGLLYLDNRATELSVAEAIAKEIGLPHAVNNRTLDESHASQVIIDARLAQIERLALTEGYAVAIAHPFPLTLERLATWSETLEARGFILVPISTVANR